jgi:rod shape-determining protein MreD
MSWQIFIAQMGRAVWLSVPFGAALLLTLLTMAPGNLFGGVVSAPNFGVIAVFFWAVYAPQLFPPAAAFALGLSMDLLGAGPIGFWALLLLALYGVTLSQRPFFLARSVAGVWAGFAAFAAITALIGWFLSSVYFAQWAAPWPPAREALMSALFFPLVGRIFFGLRRFLTAAPERAYQ